MSQPFKTFAEASLPPEKDIETEGETQLEKLKEHLAWFYSRGVKVVIKPSKTGYKLDLVKASDVVVERK